MTPSSPEAIQFGAFEFNPVRGELRKHGLRVRLTPHESALLSLLLETPLRVRTREEIQRRLWPSGMFVDFEHGLNKVVHCLRVALGDSAVDPRFIETVNATGYRFIPQFAEVSPASRNGTSPQRVAVLPIPAEGSEQIQDHCQQIACYLIDGLAAMGGIRVVAQSTLKNYKVHEMNAQQAGELLGVYAVVSGQLTRSGGVLFLRTELVDVSDGSQLCSAYAEQPDVPGKDCDKELANRILKQLKPVLLPAPRKVVSALTPGHRSGVQLSQRATAPS
jgi:DNA-binding winged helix-turn-helix (wHTH) protein